MKKIPCCQQQPLFKALLILTLFVSFDAFAVSKLHYCDASVTIKNNQPCFYVNGKKDRRFSGLGVSRLFNYGAYETPTLWNFKIDDKNYLVPVAKETCLEYGSQLDSGFEVSRKAQPLKMNTPYVALLLTEPMICGVKFCLTTKSDNSLLLVGIGHDENHQCTSEPLNDEDKPLSLWQRIF